MLKKLTPLLFIFTIYLLFPQLADAHPVDEIGNVNIYDQKQILELSSQKAHLKIDLTFYAFEKMEVWGSINTNADQNLTEKEKDRWMRMGSDASWLEVSGKKYPFTATNVTIPNYDDFFSSKPVDIAIEFDSKLKVKPGDAVTYFYKGKDKKLEEITLVVTGRDGLNVSEIKKDSADSATFKIDQGFDTGSKTYEVNTSDRLNQFLDKYVKADKISPVLLLTAIVVSFLIGMLHALTPGHGKAIVAGYLVGEKGTISHAIQLGLIITITHTASVFILGMGALFLAEYFVPEVVIKWMTLVSGVLVTLFGLYLLIIRVRTVLITKSKNHTHSDFDEIIETGKNAAHSHHGHTHTHSHAIPAAHHHDIELSWKNLLPLGISGGLVPCVDALAILIVAISLGKLVLGLTLLVVFSLGLASALIIGGVIVVLAKSKAFKKFESIEKFEKYSSIVSAAIVTALGLAIIFGKPI